MSFISERELKEIQEARFGLLKAQTGLKEAQAQMEKLIQSLVEKYKLIGLEDLFNIQTGQYSLTRPSPAKEAGTDDKTD